MKVEVVLCVERGGGVEGGKGQRERRREGRERSGVEWKWKERRGEEDGVCGKRRAGRGGGGEGVAATFWKTASGVLPLPSPIGVFFLFVKLGFSFFFHVSLFIHFPKFHCYLFFKKFPFFSFQFCFFPEIGIMYSASDSYFPFLQCSMYLFFLLSLCHFPKFEI